MKIKPIIFGLLAFIVVSLLFFTALWASHQPAQSPCSWLRVEITDSLDRQFVETAELRQLLYREGLLPIGQTMEDISCQAIEDCLLRHDMVRSAECYKSVRGGVCVRVTQRVPALHVLSNDGAYYVDNDRSIMPVRKAIDIDVPVFKGAVGKRAATEEYYDFAKWLTSNNYWRSRIQYVQVHNPKHLVLSQGEGEGKIILGDLSEYAEKMNKLQKLYTKGFEKIGQKEYREYDLRYDGQVIGRK
jgi:cell division protein FtsQ